MSSTTQKLAFSEKLANRIISKERWKDDEEGYLKVKYGLEVIIINVTKLVIVWVAALILGVFFQMLVVHLTYLILRRYSFGLHAKNSFVCTLTSLAMFALGPFLFQNVSSNNIAVVMVFAFVLFNMYLFAPADTESLPLMNKDNRKKLKRKAVVSTVIITGITVFIPFAEMKTLIMLGALYQAICINPITYKVLRRQYQNYRFYESEV
ncbi:accessory gene regulator B family protein [Listeria sp. PSOL-1]|uniref:accessory gene regulator B family protein n=1 Tax=Listeria sp. PSOL-1 TaxID=1844999 RepID=UPI0013D69299|nr:accessory gene regulator B family protein [Listeria sp. PSOL-1]